MLHECQSDFDLILLPFLRKLGTRGDKVHLQYHAFLQLCFLGSLVRSKVSFYTFVLRGWCYTTLFDRTSWLLSFNIILSYFRPNFMFLFNLFSCCFTVSYAIWRFSFGGTGEWHIQFLVSAVLYFHDHDWISILVVLQFDLMYSLVHNKGTKILHSFVVEWQVLFMCHSYLQL